MYISNCKRMHKYLKFPAKYHKDILDDTQNRKLKGICDCQTKVVEFHLEYHCKTCATLISLDFFFHKKTHCQPVLISKQLRIGG